MCTPKKLLFCDEAKWSPERPQQQRKLSRRDLKRTKEKGEKPKLQRTPAMEAFFCPVHGSCEEQATGSPDTLLGCTPYHPAHFFLHPASSLCSSSASDLFFCGEFSPICEKHFQNRRFCRRFSVLLIKISPKIAIIAYNMKGYYYFRSYTFIF